MEDIDVLKPCPFCGKAPEIVVNPIRGYEPCVSYRITCRNCGVEPRYNKNDTVYYSVTEILKSITSTWNRRV